MRQYSADNIDLAWLGLDLKDGLAAGTFVQEARANPTWTPKPSGAVPKITRIYDVGRHGTVTITVDQESQLHQSLKALANAERDPAQRNKVADMVLTDNSAGEKITWKNACIMTIPDRSRGVESTTFPWVFLYEDFEDVEVETLLNSVGN